MPLSPTAGQATRRRGVVTDDEEAPLLVKDEDQTVTGKVKTGDGNKTEEFEYAYPEYYEIANVFNDAMGVDLDGYLERYAA